MPDNHGNKEIAELEFNLKQSLVSAEEEREGARVFSFAPHEFFSAYVQLEWAIGKMEKKDAKQIVTLLAQLGEQYNKLYANNKKLALQFHKTLFKSPIRAGWDRTTTVERLHIEYGTIERGGGIITKNAPSKI